ncbi:lysophospholipase [Ascoidea rubescens DSM 1968]|uniref:Lysophospholipase NTE1 n=1 Tax=Ascoidea rubescens DSM 1968 TaxID=1344418 RepID=A0A1D2VK99_9ASCO|nr:patatin-domain-containing protein [Ascoidea rubescens DSM 1968]ODV62023.1 patatin-domain-containing protein [Ascoidea rubescens DSM 1968]
MLSRNVSITLPFTYLLIFLFFFAALVYSVVRYKYLTAYSKFNSDIDLGSDSFDNNQNQEKFKKDYRNKNKNKNKNLDAILFNPKDLFEEKNSQFSSYLDEFLYAIKIFGYLEKPVFHELTKSMRTQKLDQNEVLFLDNSIGFSIVVEGTIQVFSKVDNNNNNNNNINNDNSISSNDDNDPNSFDGLRDNFDPDNNKNHNFDNNYNTNDDSYVLNNQKYQLLNNVKSGAPLSSLISVLSLFTGDNNDFISKSSNFQLNQSNNLNQLNNSNNDSINPNQFQNNQQNLILPNIIAKASTDVTIAIIPADSFRRLIRKYPRSASHIVQMILTRLGRVTFQAAHSYLGLTNQLVETEIKLNENTTFELPSYYIKSDIKLKPTLNGRSRHVILDSKNQFNPGDLLSNVPLSRKEFPYRIVSSPTREEIRMRTFSAEEETEETSLRIALIENIFKILGISRENLKPPLNKTSSSTSILSDNNYSPTKNFLSFSTTPTPLTLSMVKRFNQKNNFNSHNFSTLNGNTLSSIYDEEENSDHPISYDYDNAKKEFADDIEIIFFKEDSTIINQNSQSNGLYYLIDGFLDVSYKDNSNGSDYFLYTIKPGGIGGYLSSVVGYKSFVTMKAKTDVYLGYLSKNSIEKLCEKYFMIYLSLARKLCETIQQQNPLILLMDFAVEWIQTPSNHNLYIQNEEADSIHIVLNGRFRSYVQTEDGETKEVDEYGQGSSLGEVEVLTAAKRPSTLVAVRDSETASIPRTLFEYLALKDPSITIKISRLVAERVLKKSNDISYSSFFVNSKYEKTNFYNYKTLTILPITNGLPVAEFGEKLANAFKSIEKTVMVLDQTATLNHLGRHAFDRLSKLKQSGYFEDIEERYQIVLYIANTPVNSSWTKTCISQGDCILLLADALSYPDIGDYERLLLKMRTSARIELILLHPHRYVPPGLTNKWLKPRLWVSSHHHIQLDFIHSGDSKGFMVDESSLESYGSILMNSLIVANLRSKVQTIRNDIFLKYSKLRSIPFYQSSQSYKNDFLRLARILSGQAVGLVLGGGGARGIAHVGVIKALEDNGIPIDIIGGTSIGSFVGGLYSRDYEFLSIFAKTKKFSGRMSSIWRMITDLTYPITSYTTGHEFNRGIWKAFGQSRIEDFWLQYFCNSTNITNSEMEIHSSGYSWRYIRASMSLAGMVPPLIDNGCMLLDGGYVDNLPVMEMKNHGASIILAVDVGSIDDRTPMSYGDSLSGTWAFFNRFNPFSKQPNVPNMAEIQMRLAYVASVNALERAKRTPGVIYLRPPIDDFGTLEFGNFDKIYQVGMDYTVSKLKELQDHGKFPKIPGATGKHVKNERPINQRRNSI